MSLLATVVGAVSIVFLLLTPFDVEATSPQEVFSHVLKSGYGIVVADGTKQYSLKQNENFTISVELIPYPVGKETVRLRTVLVPPKGTFKISAAALPGMEEMSVFVDLLQFKYFHEKLLKSMMAYARVKIGFVERYYADFVEIYFKLQNENFEIVQEKSVAENKEYLVEFNRADFSVRLGIKGNYLIVIHYKKLGKEFGYVFTEVSLQEIYNKELADEFKAGAYYIPGFFSGHVTEGITYAKDKSCKYFITMAEAKAKLNNILERAKQRGGIIKENDPCFNQK